MLMASFATPAELAVYSQNAISAADNRAQPALDAASEIIRAYCGWHISPINTNEVVLVDGGGQILSLPTLHLTGVSGVKVDGTTIDAGTYTWNTVGEMRRAGEWWSTGYRSVEVTMTHGWATVAAVKQLSMAMAARSLVGPVGGVVREQTLASSVTWAQTAPGVSGGVVLMEHEKQILAPYRIVTA